MAAMLGFFVFACGGGAPSPHPTPRNVVVGTHVTLTETGTGDSILLKETDRTGNYMTRVARVRMAAQYLQRLCGHPTAYDDGADVATDDSNGTAASISFGGAAQNDNCIKEASATSLP